MPLSHTDDNVLLQLYCKNGDKRAFGVLYQRYVTMVLSVCLKYTRDEQLSEDLTQQVFEKLLRIVCQHEIKYFKSWLYQTTRNHCLMYLRKKNPVDLNSEKIENQKAQDSAQAIADKKSKEEKYARMEVAVQKLKPEQKKCLELFYIEKKSYAQIQQSTGWTFKEVKSHLQNAKRNLKKALDV